MKKVVVMCIAVVAACVAQAAAVQWNSGVIYLSDGTTKAVKDQVTAYFWESTSSSAFADLTAADLFAAKDNTSSISGYVKSQNSTALSALNLTSGTVYASGTTVYSAILYVNNVEGGYLGNFGQVTAGTAKMTVADMSIYEGGSFGGVSGAALSRDTWGAGTPEPTSGLLLLVGGAMLALRRKQK